MKTKCIEEETIADYLEGRLSGKAHKEVETHLSICDSCLEEVIVGTEIVKDLELSEFEPVPERVTRRALDTITLTTGNSLFEKITGYVEPLVTKLSDGLQGGLPFQGPSLAVVRGNKTVVANDLIQIIKNFPGLAIHIEIEKSGPQKACIKVLSSKDEGQTEPVRVTLFENGRELSSYLLEKSVAIFDDIAFGHYNLVFSKNGKKIGDYPFEIKETRNGRK